MTCDCSPYNKDKNEILDLPEHLKDTRNNKTVCIDKCIVPVIKALWDEGFCTSGCCCGHNKTNPSIIFHNYVREYIDKNESDAINKIRAIISKVDKRTFDLYMWKLTKAEV